MAERFSPGTRALLAEAQSAARRSAEGGGPAIGDGSVGPIEILGALRRDADVDRTLQCLGAVVGGRGVEASPADPADRRTPPGSFTRPSVRALVAAAAHAAARESPLVTPDDVLVGLAATGGLPGVTAAEVEQAVAMARAGYLPV